MSEIFFYLETVGRVTGNLHKIEIWFVEHDDCYYLCSGNEQSADWVQNIQQNPTVRYAVGTSPESHAPLQSGVATVPSEETLVAAVKQKFEAKYDWSDGLIVQICPQSGP